MSVRAKSYMFVLISRPRYKFVRARPLISDSRVNAKTFCSLRLT
jgi:hypothetical protein